MRELARDLDVSHAAPSRHFKDRQALLDALALVGYERMTAVMLASQEDVGEPCRERLEAMGRAYVGFCLDNVELLDLMCSIKHDPQAFAALLDATGRWSELIERLVAEGQRQGEVREGPSRASASRSSRHFTVTPTWPPPACSRRSWRKAGWTM
ncbi:TetR/AcrR family transcriptional regulator [Streptomyces niveus]|uniref:TetR/AcrR family transcriptional regulator n=1 Tax=Streptomyces niveus TaxID=193462 RepID=UPI0036C80996